MQGHHLARPGRSETPGQVMARCRSETSLTRAKMGQHRGGYLRPLSGGQI